MYDWYDIYGHEIWNMIGANKYMWSIVLETQRNVFCGPEHDDISNWLKICEVKSVLEKCTYMK